MDSVKALLKKAKKKIEKGWCQGAMARDIDGQAVGCMTEEAASFCIYGAVISSMENGDYYVESIQLLWSIANENLVSYNDRSSKEQVLQLFDLAIGSCKE
jgi:hypothetical protein